MFTTQGRPRSRRLWGGISAVLLVAAGFVGVATINVPSAQAAPNLLCTSDAVYATNQAAGDGDLWQIDPTTGAATEVIDLPGGSVVNQLGIAPGGGKFFFTKAGVVYNYTLATDSFVSTPATALAGYSSVGGAVSPTNGLYYYGGLGGGGTSYQIAVYDPATNVNLGVAATVQLPQGVVLSNSDFAFDSLGQMYIVGSTANGGALVRVDGTMPGTGANPALTSSLLTEIAPVAGVSYAAIAFSGLGELYVGGGAGAILRINATTGAVIGSVPVTGAPGLSMTDFGTCGAPPTLTVLKDVAGRLQPTDQFALSITGGGIVPSLASTGLTEGTDLGLQTQSPEESAGSVIVQSSTTYSFGESAAGTTVLAKYSSRWECVDARGGSGSKVSSGTGATGSITIPEIAGVAVVCTIFNDPLIPGLTLDKRVTEVIDANGNGYNDVGDQIAWEFELTNTGETDLVDLAVTDDKLTARGIGVTCNPDALAPTASVVCKADAPYTIIAADLVDGKVVNTATAHGTPPGESPLVTPPDTTETPVGGYTVVKKADPASGSAVSAGSVITYTLTVTHQGLAPVPGAFLEDDLTDVLDDAAYNNDVVASSGSASVDGATGVLSWIGDLVTGDVTTITYSVTVGAGGDGNLVNTVTSQGCSTDCRTDHRRGYYSIRKDSDPKSGSTVSPGGVITYTLTVTQEGPGTVPGARLDDDLTAVLDDAKYNDNASATAGTVAFDPATKKLQWGGDLAVGAVVKITYSVTVTGAGDGTLRNVVSTTDPAGFCEPAAKCTTTHRVPLPPPGLAITGGGLAVGSIVGAVLVIALGTALAVRARRRERADVI